MHKPTYILIHIYVLYILCEYAILLHFCFKNNWLVSKNWLCTSLILISLSVGMASIYTLSALSVYRWVHIHCISYLFCFVINICTKKVRMHTHTKYVHTAITVNNTDATTCHVIAIANRKTVVRSTTWLCQHDTAKLIMPKLVLRKTISFYFLGCRCWITGSNTASVNQDNIWLCDNIGWTSPYITTPIIWSFALALSAPPLLGWSSFQPESSGMRYMGYFQLSAI